MTEIPQVFDPNQVEAVRRRSECLDYMVQVAMRGGGIHEGDAQVLTQLVSNLYDVLPVKNTNPASIGEDFETDRHAYIKKIATLSELRRDSPDEYAREIWRENEIFIRRCTTFMNDTLFVKPTKRKKEPTEGARYEQI